jgi:hypothetical protein
MIDQHLSPARTSTILEKNRIEHHELEHLRMCASCNGWVRAFAALASAHGKPIKFEIPPDPANPTPEQLVE